MSNYIQQLYSAKNIRDSKVYPGLNAAKGILILLVILTHALPDGMILYFLYFFHMPVFLSISGYLLKESAFKDGISKYLGKLIYRLIIPWIMASFLYLYFSLGNRHLSEITLTDFLYPFYHLWYVPAYVLGALLCYFVSNYKIPKKKDSTMGYFLTDYTFNSINAIFGRTLRTRDGQIVTLAYWQQKEAESNDEVPYYEFKK